MDMSHRSKALLEKLGYTCDAMVTWDMLCWPKPEDAQAAHRAASRLPQCKWTQPGYCPRMACGPGDYRMP